MDKIKTTLLHFGRPNENGKIYSSGDFDTTSTVLVMIDKHNTIGMKFLEQVGTADITKNADTLEAEINLTGDHKEYALEKIEEGEKFVVDGSGYVEESGYIRNYKLMRIIITNDTKNFY